MLTITLYRNPDDVDCFQVYEAVDEDTLTDVTEDYEVAFVQLEDGRVGTVVVKK